MILKTYEFSNFSTWHVLCYTIWLYDFINRRHWNLFRSCRTVLLFCFFHRNILGDHVACYVCGQHKEQKNGNKTSHCGQVQVDTNGAQCSGTDIGSADIRINGTRMSADNGGIVNIVYRTLFWTSCIFTRSFDSVILSMLFTTLLKCTGFFLRQFTKYLSIRSASSTK